MQCQQMVTLDSCCNPTQCPESASWLHAATGLTLCAEHYGNGVKYAVDGQWYVGNRAVALPDGWIAVEPEAAGAGIEAVRLDAPDGSGLVIESAPLSASGLVLEPERRTEG